MVIFGIFVHFCACSPLQYNKHISWYFNKVDR